jgi:hypothetical protein
MFESCRAHSARKSRLRRTTFGRYALRRASVSEAGQARLRGRRTASGAESRRVAEIPDTIVLKRHRDLDGRHKDVWFRRSLLALVALIPVLALFNVFGQHPGKPTVATAAARLQLYAPSRARGGLLYEARFHITARQEIKNAILVLDPGWAEGQQINTIEPSPTGEASRDGQLELTLGHIPQGQTHLLFMQFQVNPTNVAWRRPLNVELFDGNTHLLTLKHKLTVYP